MEQNFNQFEPPESVNIQTGNRPPIQNPNVQQPVRQQVQQTQNFQPPVQQNYQQQQPVQSNYNQQPPVQQNYQNQQQPVQQNNNQQQSTNFNEYFQPATNQAVQQNYSMPNSQPKYKIVDLYWLMHPKCEDSEPNFKENEAQFVAISYNIVFGNLKVTLFNIPQGAIHGHVLFYNNLQRLTTGTIYNGSCGKLLYSNCKEFTCLEQLFSNTGQEWQTKRQMCSFNKIDDNNILLSIVDPTSGTFTYNFTDWQIKLLLKSCEFCLTEGTKLTGLHKMNQ